MRCAGAAVNLYKLRGIERQELNAECPALMQHPPAVPSAASRLRHSVHQTDSPTGSRSLRNTHAARIINAIMATSMPERLKLHYVKLLEGATPPTYAHGAAEDAGMDLFAAEDVVLPPRQWRSVRTGLSIQIPEGYDGQIRPRSGLARRYGLTILNSPGTIDPGYRGEIRVTLINFGAEPYHICAGDRIAQLIVSRYTDVQWELVECLKDSHRGSGGFGSTGR